MNPLKAIMQQASSGMQLESRRITVAAENISNVDTPGYHKKMIAVESALTPGQQFSVTKEMLDQSPGERSYNPSHPMADQDGYVTMSNVSLVMEMADLREANRSYEANLNAFQQARSMYSSLLDILRR
ncbi:flagellar basal body rod C-terminal domain-containing protein [Hyphomonas johnsonii]|jgi:flagellar basal-body rod protein FlgC|uniref:Flagellar basal-body rod protein n=1 Tax=Hyphomonas johnsonii MHS-2 TaxID=1280950 RepID=A0A059FNN9_9PROT|nr:flagellar basal body rod C-terminal domain-containing protein [Hyphomonas johnsonii]KCZ92237.1 flagellar basal-body rod protein [Hyphomonas johnsonii MHS-2]